MKNEYPIVALVWEDAIQRGDGGWSDLGDYMPLEAYIVHTSGFLVEETEDQLLIACAVDSEGKGTGHLQLPRSAVREMKVLQKARNP